MLEMLLIHAKGELFRPYINLSLMTISVLSEVALRRSMLHMHDRPEIHLISPEPLIFTECVDDGRVVEIEAELLRERRWRFPVLVHPEGGFVMDGHHRVMVARRLRLAALPAIFLDYDLVDVEAWRQGETITPEMIFAMARGGGRFPSKTTRHRSKVELPRCDIPLSCLATPVARWRPQLDRHLLSYR